MHIQKGRRDSNSCVLLFIYGADCFQEFLHFFNDGERAFDSDFVSEAENPSEKLGADFYFRVHRKMLFIVRIIQDVLRAQPVYDSIKQTVLKRHRYALSFAFEHPECAAEIVLDSQLVKFVLPNTREGGEAHISHSIYTMGKDFSPIRAREQIQIPFIHEEAIGTDNKTLTILSENGFLYIVNGGGRVLKRNLSFAPDRIPDFAGVQQNRSLLSARPVSNEGFSFQGVFLIFAAEGSQCLNDARSLVFRNKSGCVDTFGQGAQIVIFIRTDGFGFLGKSPVHYETGVSGIDLKDVFHIQIPLPSRDLLGSVVDTLDLLAVVLTALLDFGELSQEPGLDLEEGLRLAVLAVRVDGPLGDKGEGGLLLIGAVLPDISLDGIHVQGRKGGLGLLGLNLDDAGTGIVTAGCHYGFVLLGAILLGLVHLSGGQFDGVGGEVDVHGFSFLRFWRYSVGRYPNVF